MKNKIKKQIKKAKKHDLFWVVFGLVLLVAISFVTDAGFIFSKNISYVAKLIEKEIKKEEPKILPLDKELYDKKMEELANNPLPLPPKTITKKIKDPETGELKTVTEIVPVPEPKYIWPVKTVYPKGGAMLPFKRIVAYYGNLYSTKMGVLGEYAEDIMLGKLEAEVAKWNLADPETPVQPALHYIAVTAQGSPGESGMYRLRMPDSEIDKVLAMAKKINGIVFLDIQVGLSSLQAELPIFEDYLKMPEVHLGIDPEFSMKTGKKPGTVIGTFDASDINYASEYLAKIVRDNNLPPKVLVVHRFTQGMITNYKNIKILPEVQIVIDMDGWGGKAKKIGTYKHFIYPEPIQFTGFKLFYKNDIKEPGTTIFSPEELLKLNPRPIYIQYQ